MRRSGRQTPRRRDRGGELDTPARRGNGLRIALVGCGNVCAHKHLPALQRVTGARVVAAVDVDPDRCARVADRFGIEHRFDDVRQLVAAGVADLIGVLVPPAEHASVAVAAIESGAHVLVEKPLALSLADADAMIAAARDGPGRVVMGFHMRWHRLVRQARAIVRQGKLGPLESIHTVWYSPRGDAETPQWMWRRDSGGGALIELGVHLADLWRHLLATEVCDVYARARHGTRDDATVLLAATLANGALASASLSERTSHSIEVEICGSHGRLALAGQRFDGLALYATHESAGMPGPRLRALARTLRELPRGVARMRRLGDYGDSFRGMWQHAVEVAAGACEPECTLADGRAALEVVLAASAAAEGGGGVRVSAAPAEVVPPARTTTQ